MQQNRILLTLVLLLYTKIKAVVSRCKRPKYKGPSSMDYRERESHARGVYPTQDTSRIETAMVKQEEKVGTKKIVKE